MNGSTAAGLATSKDHPGSAGFRKPLDESVARDLRTALHRGLRDAGYSAEQTRQITGWPTRTIRRDVASAPASDRRRDPRRPRGDDARPAAADDPRSDPRRRLTPREVRSLREEYGSAGLATPEVAAFLATLPTGEASQAPGGVG